MALARPSPVAVPVDDARLVELVRGGDSRAFATLYHRHARYLAGVVFRLTGREPDVDDVLQETFLDALGAIHQLRDPSGLRSWLAAIAVRRVHKRLARRRRLRFLERAVELVSPKASDPHDQRRVDELYEVLETLSPDTRLPWVLHHVEGETLPAVAELCNVSLATVKRRIAEAEEKIDRRLHGAR